MHRDYRPGRWSARSIDSSRRWPTAMSRGEAGTAIPPEPVTRPEDVPLHEDVRWLAETLGRVIDRLEGPDAFGAVEGLRQACRDRRRGHPDAATFATILERVAALPVDLSAVTARAFTLFFLLIN